MGREGEVRVLMNTLNSSYRCIYSVSTIRVRQTKISHPCVSENIVILWRVNNKTAVPGYPKG